MNPWKENKPPAAKRLGERLQRTAPVAGENREAELLEKLPSAYRENPGLLRPLLEAADELLAAARAALRQKGEGLAGELAGAARGSWRGAFSEGGVHAEAGTLVAVLAALAARLPARPRIWSSFEALALEDGALELRRALRPAVVFAWDQVEVPAPPAGPLVAADLLPAGVKVQAVWLEKVDKPFWQDSPPDGARVAGKIFWSHGS